MRSEKVAHGGAFVGYRAEMIRFPEERLSVVCLCNRSDGRPSRRAQDVADLNDEAGIPYTRVTEALDLTP